jgi:ATP-dependent Clp protease ATP-binding subunit ClpC
MLLGLIRENEGIAARVLRSLEITAEDVRARLEAGDGERPTGQIPFLPDAKQSMDGALREALVMGHRFIGTEHLLLGLVREDGYASSRLLAEIGAPPARVRERVLAALSGE